MRILIIEDEPETAAHLQRLIQQYAPPELQLAGPLRSIRESIEYLHNQPPPDLIFLDIQLADGLSFEIFDEIELQTPIVFTTAYNQFLQRAFEVNSLDFLLKPIRYEHLARSLDKYQKLYQQKARPGIDSRRLRDILPWERHRYRSRFLVKRGKRLVVIPTAEIAYLLKDDIVLLITLEGRKFPLPHSLEEAAQLLDPQFFFRINRQCIVHLQAIREIRQEGNQLLLSIQPTTANWLTVSQRNIPAFKNWLAGA
ncbi:LytR/AlgR family response regulator transcription factor [Flavilitoribacter nigricans]|uniref:DNA-binding response regulator n=1 Tax=Flavilitoribacter nigricans (strain ATCC 23147 / DSM 23189 / NBRC 102662 / NCIMB 1420 / SS-2) TaxID=1122177 RepID=A0A2D0N9D4_FLAN2|nr:LytTR family DNA-binding domain-containing protein [Flavilitoribacter nigricans]PHN05095.1 DNA-binding response regulator [Flavilitoribacter nigricans DSM 23189 = NBRC 102662]